MSIAICWAVQVSSVPIVILTPIGFWWDGMLQQLPLAGCAHLSFKLGHTAGLLGVCGSISCARTAPGTAHVQHKACRSQLLCEVLRFGCVPVPDY